MNLTFEDKTIAALRWIIGILDDHKVEYQISGGFAGKVFGSARELHDIDIDIPEKRFSDILPDIIKYITYGPARYKDAKWDLTLITLDYQGQEIDISGADSILISNKERTAWIPVPVDFATAIDADISGIRIRVINPKDMIEYKSELDGNHQSEDIRAAKQYMAGTSLVNPDKLK